MTGGEGKKRTRRSYRPAVEIMEALRLLSSAAAASFPGLVAEHNVLADHGAAARPLVSALPSVSGETWDAALLQTHLTDQLSGVGSAFVSSSASTSTSDASALSSGLAQLNKYLSRAWYRAAIPVQMHEDCTQAVYTTMLQQLGRNQFDTLISDVGRSGIKDVFSRETNEGLDFFRAVDMIKKRASPRASVPLARRRGCSGLIRQCGGKSLERCPARGHGSLVEPPRGQPYQRNLDGQDPGRNCASLGRRAQDRQQREGTRSSETA